jgi:transcriptional antiterminator NusG
MGNWYVFHVQTGREQTACDFLNKLFDREESSAFVPK